MPRWSAAGTEATSELGRDRDSGKRKDPRGELREAARSPTVGSAEGFDEWAPRGGSGTSSADQRPVVMPRMARPATKRASRLYHISARR